ncbi:hypothetical protein IJS77_02885 [bacterium]|nr:hypothetical protein [bacterium]
MNIHFNTFSPSFSGKYTLDANQKMETQDACLRRDFALGFICEKANNGEEVKKTLNTFYGNEYYKSPDKQVNITIDLPYKYDGVFEQLMAHLGQNFEKIG